MTGKYGAEGEQLLFKVLNSGNFPGKLEDDLRTLSPSVAAHQLCEKGLRYDLTIPLARYVAQHAHGLTFPFRRYQIQPVWRADRPQRGRYREFYQCDIDVIGAPSPFVEAEMLALVDEVFSALGLEDYRLLVNHRAILGALAEAAGAPHLAGTLARALDKRDKVPEDKMIEDLTESGFSSDALEKMAWIYAMPQGFAAQLAEVEGYLGALRQGAMAAARLRALQTHLTSFAFPAEKLVLAPTLARGMDYYTGLLFEAVIPASGLGSLGGGGRYDDLASLFGVAGMTGLGFSFGLERIYDLLEERNLFPTEDSSTPRLLLVPLEESTLPATIEQLTHLRGQGIAAELLPPTDPLRKSLRYAAKKKIPWVALHGGQEKTQGKVTLRDMEQGTQEMISWADLPTHIDRA